MISKFSLFLVTVPFCENPSLLRTIVFLKYILGILKIGAPLLLIVVMMIQFTKNLFEDTDINKLVKIFSSKIVLTIMLYLIPTILIALSNFIRFSPSNSCWDNATTANIEVFQAKYDELLKIEKDKILSDVDKAKEKSKVEASSIAKSNTYISGSSSSSLANKMLETAYSQLGYCEKNSNSYVNEATSHCGSSNYTKFNNDYSKRYLGGGSLHDAWCAAFVTWVCNNTKDSDGKTLNEKYIHMPGGNKYDGIRVGAYVKNFYNANDGRKVYKAKAHGGSYTPKRGDIITFTNDYKWHGYTGNHIGIVDTVSGGRVYTVEGNASNKVIKKNYSLDSAYINAYLVWE